jgi:hypothetical protein
LMAVAAVKQQHRNQQQLGHGHSQRDENSAAAATASKGTCSSTLLISWEACAFMDLPPPCSSGPG